MSGKWCRHCQIWNPTDQNYCTCCGAELFKIAYHVTEQRGRPSNAEMSYGAMQRENGFKKWYVEHYPKGENTAKTYSSKLKNVVNKMPDALQRKLKSNLFEYDDAKEFENVIKELSVSSDFWSFDKKSHAQASTAMRQYLSFLGEKSGDVDENNTTFQQNKESEQTSVNSNETVEVSAEEYKEFLARKNSQQKTVENKNTTSTENIYNALKNINVIGGVAGHNESNLSTTSLQKSSFGVYKQTKEEKTAKPKFLLHKREKS